jgi:hypothetical protein
LNDRESAVTELGWLHLSDFHAVPLWQRPDLREAIERDLRLVHALSGPWDSANKRRASLSVSSTSPTCVIVPGNHDLDWDAEVYIPKQRRSSIS